MTRSDRKTKRVLMLAYAFPPINTSGSGRPCAFAMRLGDIGWDPVVLTRKGVDSFQTDYEMAAAVEDRCEVVRARCLDGDNWSGWLSRHLPAGLENCMMGRPRQEIVRAAAWRIECLLPQLHEGVHWVWPAVMKGLDVHRRRRVDAIWATCGPASTLMAGYWLSRLTGRPLVADIRDPWTYGPQWTPVNERWAHWQRMWERRVLTYAARTVYTSPLTAEIKRCGLAPEGRSRLVAITNGYREQPVAPRRDVAQDKCLFSYVGVLKKGLRRPEIVFEGLRSALSDPELARDVVVQFVGTMGGFESELSRWGLDDHVICTGMVPRIESLRYMQGSDVLLLIQTIEGEGSDVIAGKCFEYLKAHKPILAVVSEGGGDAWLMREVGGARVTGLGSSEAVANGIRHYWSLWKAGRLAEDAPSGEIARFGWERLTRRLAAVLNDAVDDWRPGADGQAPHPARGGP